MPLYKKISELILFCAQFALSLQPTMAKKRKLSTWAILRGLMKRVRIRHWILIVWIGTVLLFQQVEGWGEYYARHLYPTIGKALSSLSGKVDVCLSDTFYFLLIGLALLWIPISIWMLKRKKKRLLADFTEAALWLYVWFYSAWGLNYWQDNFYLRTGVGYVEYSSNSLGAYVSAYIYDLNDAYVPVEDIDSMLVKQEILKSYEAIYAQTGMNKPLNTDPQVKTMFITPLASMVAVTGSMGPFFGEFTINGEVLPVDYPHIYAHELSHLYGITSEGEANFYAYLACMHSDVPEIRFSGLLSVFSHLMNNVRTLMGESSYAHLIKQVRPEIRLLVRDRQAYWMDRYNPYIGKMQDLMYDFYLRQHRIEGGRKNYSAVVGLLMAWDERQKVSP